MILYRAENITKTYENNIVLKNISINVHKSDFILIKGESGVGKSTLLYILGGLLKADTGKLYFKGDDVFQLTDKVVTEFRKKHIGMIYQDSYMIEALTLKENLLFVQKNKLGKVKEDSINHIINELGLGRKQNNFLKELSGGEKRRAMIASVLISEPDIILADEPTNDLDSKWADKVMELLYDMSVKGRAVIIATHIYNNIEYFNKKYKLDNGRLIGDIH